MIYERASECEEALIFIFLDEIYIFWYEFALTNVTFSIYAEAKTTKKITLRLECKECKYKHQIPLKRAKHFEIGAPSKK